MKRIILLAILFIVFCCWPSSLLAKDTRPNVLLIVVDDMGYSDIGPFGGEVRTPALVRGGGPYPGSRFSGKVRNYIH